MSKDMPWVDIHPAAAWDEYIVQYQKGDLSFNADKLGQSKFSMTLKKAFKFGKRTGHNEFLTKLSVMVKSYHNVEKPQAGTLTLRANMLDSIVLHVESYMKKQGLTRQDTHKNTLAYLLLKLTRRAGRKAAYIRELKKHNDNHAKGFQGFDGLMAYLHRDRERDDDLAAMQSDVLMERLDPWHRVFEMKLDGRNTIGASYIDGALKMWMFNKQAHDTPFFVWLEDNYVCTGVDKDGTLRLSYADGVDLRVRRGVTYLNEGSAMPLLVCFSGGFAYTALRPDGSDQLPLMEKCPTPSKQPGAYAYVWTKDGLLLCGNHAAGSFHHSSFTSGRKVRCAGMIQFQAGKVVLVSNDSGHYRPGAKLLKNFAVYLQHNGALDPDCIIMDISAGRKLLSI